METQTRLVTYKAYVRDRIPFRTQQLQESPDPISKTAGITKKREHAVSDRRAPAPVKYINLYEVPNLCCTVSDIFCDRIMLHSLRHCDVSASKPAYSPIASASLMDSSNISSPLSVCSSVITSGARKRTMLLAVPTFSIRSPF